MPEAPLDAVAIAIEMTDDDAGQLWHTAVDWGEFGEEARRRTSEDFESLAPLPEDAAPRATWRRAYWVGECYASLLLLRSYVAARGHDYEVFWDTTPSSPMGESGTFRGYVILTDWAS